MWNCAERHLKRRPTEAVPYPDPACKPKGIVLKNKLQFKNHAKIVHNRDLRPKVTIQMTLNSPIECTRSIPKIIFTPTKQHQRIILRVRPLLQPALVPDVLSTPESPKYLAQFDQPPVLHPLSPCTIPIEYINPAIREDSPKGCQAAMNNTPGGARSLIAVDIVETSAATSKPDEVQYVPDYIVNGEEF